MMKQIFFFSFLVLFHTWPLWNMNENLAGGFGDPMAHAAIGEWFCKNVVLGDFKTDRYLYPMGANMAGNYDSPFPFVLTCPFVEKGGLFQFHLFTVFQLLLIVLSASMVAFLHLRSPILRIAYVFFVWWSGYYLIRSQQHITLLSNIWGAQWVLYVSFLPPSKSSWKSFLTGVIVMGLVFAGTFQNFPNLFLLAGVLWIFRIFRDWGKGRTLRGEIGNLFFLGILIAIVWGPIIFFMTLQGLPDLESQRNLYNFDLYSILLPGPNHMLYSHLPENLKLSFERSLPMDYGVLLGVFVALFTKAFWEDRRRWILFGLALVYFYWSLGPELRLGNEVKGSLPWNSWIFEQWPLRLTRTPARLAQVTEMLFILLAFLAWDSWLTPLPKVPSSALGFFQKTVRFLNIHREKILGCSLIIWIIITGPIFQNRIFFPTVQYRKILPMQGLESLATRKDDFAVVQIPAAWAQDPSQNFQQLIHHKKMTAGYLAYPAYTGELRRKFQEDPFLGGMFCEGRKGSKDLFNDFEILKGYLKGRRFEAFVIQKGMLLQDPACQELKEWVIEFLKQPWIKILQENEYYGVVTLIDNNNPTKPKK